MPGNCWSLIFGLFKISTLFLIFSLTNSQWFEKIPNLSFCKNVLMFLKILVFGCYAPKVEKCFFFFHSGLAHVNRIWSSFYLFYSCSPC